MMLLLRQLCSCCGPCPLIRYSAMAGQDSSRCTPTTWRRRSHKFCGMRRNHILSTNWPARGSTPTRSCCEPLPVSHTCGRFCCRCHLPYGTHWPVLLRCCRGRHSPAIRSNLCRSTLRPPKTYRGFAHLEFRRERSKTNSKRSSGKTNQEFRERDYTDCPALATTERLGGCDADAV